VIRRIHKARRDGSGNEDYRASCRPRSKGRSGPAPIPLSRGPLWGQATRPDPTEDADDMRPSDLVDVAVPMAAFFEREDEARPEDALRRRRDAARRLLDDGFTPAEVDALYGKASLQEATGADAASPAPVGRLRTPVAGSAVPGVKERAMTDRDSIKTTVELFCNAVNGSSDARDPAVAEAVRACTEAHSAWVGAGAVMPAAEPVLQAANNPEGLPFAYRDMATETQTILDKAAEQGFQVTAAATPAP